MPSSYAETRNKVFPKIDRPGGSYRYEEQPTKGGKHMSRTIEAIMRHMVPPAKREPARKASAIVPAQKQSESNELSRRRERKLRVVFVPSQLTPSPKKELTNMLTSILGAPTELALCQRLGLRTCHRRARHRRLHPERGATRWTACHPALLLPAGSSGSRDHGLRTRKVARSPYYLVFRDTNGAPLRCSSCLAGRRYDRLPG